MYYTLDVIGRVISTSIYYTSFYIRVLNYVINFRVHTLVVRPFYVFVYIFQSHFVLDCFVSKLTPRCACVFDIFVYSFV